MGPRATLLLPCLLLACGDSTTATFIQAPTDPTAVEFFVHLRDLRPLQTWRSNELAQGPIQLTQEDTDQVAHVSVPRAELDAVDPLLGPETLDALTLETSAPCEGCAGVCAEAGSTQLSLPLPASTTISELDDGVFGFASASLQTQLERNTRLQLQRAADQCTWSGRKAPEPFAPEDVRLSRDDERVLIIDRDRILFYTTQRIMLALRGRAQADNERRTLPRSALQGVNITRVGVLSRTSTVVRMLVMTRPQLDVGPQESWVYEVEAADDGFRVLGLRARAEGVLNTLVVTPDGGFVAVGDRGLVVVAPRDAALMRYTIGESFRLLAVDLFPEYPGLYFMGGAFGLIAEGDVFGGPSAMRLTSVQRADGIVDASVLGMLLRPSPEGAEVWGSTRGQGAFRRRGPGDWVPVDIESPPGLSECSQPLDACGRSRLIEITEGLAFGPDGRLFQAPWQCGRLFTRLPEDACTQEVDLSGATGGASEAITDLRWHEDRLYLVRDRRVWSIEL